MNSIQREFFEQKYDNFEPTPKNRRFEPLPKPGLYLLHFIGGAFNATQEYVSAENCSIKPEGFWDKTTEMRDGWCFHTHRYKLTFIPARETPFAENVQVVIALYQENQMSHALFQAHYITKVKLTQRALASDKDTYIHIVATDETGAETCIDLFSYNTLPAIINDIPQEKPPETT